MSGLSICDDVWYIILDNLSSYDITNLRLTCKHLSNLINHYFYLKLDVNEYVQDHDYHNQYLIERTDMQMVIILFKEYNIFNKHVLQCLDYVKYIHTLNDHFGQLVNKIIRSKQKDIEDIYDMVRNELKIERHEILELIHGTNMDIIFLEGFDNFDVCNTMMYYYDYLIFNENLQEEYKDIIKVDRVRRIDIW